MKNRYIILLLCSVMLCADIASAQGFSLFAKQRVVVADVIDRSDRGLHPAVKTLIKQGLVDACVGSEDYEIYEVNIDDVKQQLKAAGKPDNFRNVCTQIGSKAEYIIFTEVKLSTSEIAAQNVKIYMSASLYRIAVASEVKSAFVEAQASEESILSATSALFSELLGVGVASTQSTVRTTPQSASHSPAPQSKSYAVGDYYDDGVKQGVVFVVTPDGKHGKIVSLYDLGKFDWWEANTQCSSLGSGWRLPTKAELLLIYELQHKLNSVLIAVGDAFNTWYWSADECESDSAWAVSAWAVYMYNGGTFNGSKGDSNYVRAVSAF